MEKSCLECTNITECLDQPHVIRKCKHCGRDLHIRDQGKNGIGVKVEKGDTFVIPDGWLQFAFSPLKSGGHFSTYGLQWFAEQIFIQNLTSQKDKTLDQMKDLESRCDKIIEGSQLLKEFDLEDPVSIKLAVAKVSENRESLEWWAMLVGVFIAALNEAMDEKDIEKAIWAMACVERCRSMLIYKEHLEEVVWMGHSAKRIVDVLRIWDGNKTNENESFWQHTFNHNVYAISQVFAVPVVFIKDAAYIGGMNVDRKNAKLVDYLFSNESSQEAVLVEIKTPATKLLGRKYRGTYNPSVELSGAVMQALDYRRTLSKEVSSVISNTKHKLTAFFPKCVVIIGNGSHELNDSMKRDAFEIFRNNSKDVEIVTYDELFRKLEVLASLFSVARSKS